MNTPGRLGLMLWLLGASLADARGKQPVACAPGTFDLTPADQVQVVTALSGLAVTGITFGPGRTISLGSCTTIGTVRAKRRVTLLTARFATCGGARKVRLKGAIPSPACGALTLSLRARHVRAIKLTAQRSTTTSPGQSCGNGRRDAGEACEGLEGCPTDQRCSATCTCNVVPTGPTTSQGLIGAALRAGQIDAATALLYRGYALVRDDRLPDAYIGDTTLGEDDRLVAESAALLRDAGVTLSAAMRAALQGFAVRPTEPDSYFSSATLNPSAAVASSRATARANEPSASACPINPQTNLPDWRPFETAHFVIWSCGGGAPDQDITGVTRLVAGTVAEEVWSTMVPATGEPLQDGFVFGPQPQNRIDVYLVEANECFTRLGGCQNPGNDAYAVAVPAGPCTAAGTGAVASASGYLVIRRADVPVLAPEPTAASPFRAIVAHEFFHLIEYRNNLSAMAYHCSAPYLPTSDGDRSWLGEASAEWAGHAFFKDDFPARRGTLLYGFQNFRGGPHGAMITLLDNGLADGSARLRPYEAYLYPFFWQSEVNDRAPIIALWRQSVGVRTPAALTDLLAARFPFLDHLRDFNVRNVNRDDLPGEPLAPLHVTFDPALQPGVVPVYFLEPGFTLETPIDAQTRPVDIEPLAAQYESYSLDPQIQYVKLDFTSVPSFENLSIDVIAGEANSWERKRISGPIFEFCREDVGQNYDQFKLVLSNANHRADGHVGGSYKVTAKRTCPARWSGYVKTVETEDDVGEYADMNESRTRNHHLRTENTWTFVGTTPATSPDSFDTIDAVWAGALVWTEFDTYTPNICLSNYELARALSVTGSGTGPQQFSFFPSDQNPKEGILSWTGATLNTITETGSKHAINCLSGPIDVPAGGSDPEAVSQLLNALPLLVPDGNDANHYAGQRTISHLEQPGLGSGMDVTDARVEWDFRRSR